MNKAINISPGNTTDIPIRLSFEQLKTASIHQPFPDYQERKRNLKSLKTQLMRYQDLIAIAIARDFGWRAPAESKLIDVMAPVLEVNHALHSLRKWMKPQRRSTELLFLTNSLKVTYQPKGVVAIICPWNFPLYLSIGPLVTCLAAGNRAMIKMPPNCPNISRLLDQMLAEVFSRDLVCVVDGNHKEAMEISHLPFDHLVFTGSPNSGKTIMANAAANLTPVTLELGGKSPAIVSRSYPITDAAKRIAHGKSFNSGQICVAPDYAMVPSEKIQDFVQALKNSFQNMFDHTAGNEHYTALIDANQEKRFLELMEDAKAKGATIIACGEKGSGKQYPLYVAINTTPDMRIRQEEIFGPLLPVLPYEKISEAIDYIVSGLRPLACYIFSHDKEERESILKSTHSGGVSINDWGWHVMNHDVPFGGIGNSGTGTYHGIEGFRTLSHAKPIFKRHRFFPIGIFYPPYGTWLQTLALKLFIGSPDDSLKLEVPQMTETKTEDKNLMNLADHLVQSAQKFPEKVAIHFSDKIFTYKELDVFSNKVANGLRNMGIQPGDKVALSCPNLPYFPMVYYGILKAGAVVVPLNVLLKPAEIAYHLMDSDAKAHFCFEGSPELPMGEMGWEAFNSAPDCKNFVMITADPTQPSKVGGVDTLGLMIRDQAAEADLQPTVAEDTAVILYTSGTTGQPKGAELTHSNMAMNAKASQKLLDLTEKDTQLITLPLFHSFGQSIQMNACIYTGAAMVLIPRFDPDAVLSGMLKHNVSIFAGVPTMYIGLLNFPGAANYDLEAIAKHLRIAASGGSSMPVEIIRQFEEKFNVPILEGYGLSETSPVATFNHLDKPRIPGSIGQSIEGVSVKVVNPEGIEVKHGEDGELVIKGHNVMKGYYKRPEATADSIKNDWFHTGDIGKKDEDDNIYIVDRLKEMIIRGGFNVYPREIEEVLIAHENVTMVAVIGIPHEVHGEEIKAYVVCNNDFNDEAALRAWSKGRLADYKYPRHIEFRESLPMTATGKLLKKDLKAELVDLSNLSDL